MINLRSATFLCSTGLILIAVIIVLGLAHLNTNLNLSSDQDTVRAAVQNENPSSGSIKILNHQMTKPMFGNWKVKGQVKNIGSDQLRYAAITVNFYDKNGNLLYFSSVNLNNIDPGETKDFEVIYQGPDTPPDSYKLDLGPSL